VRVKTVKTGGANVIHHHHHHHHHLCQQQQQQLAEESVQGREQQALLAVDSESSSLSQHQVNGTNKVVKKARRGLRVRNQNVENKYNVGKKCHKKSGGQGHQKMTTVASAYFQRNCTPSTKETLYPVYEC
jgi:hypothetical protein